MKPANFEEANVLVARTPGDPNPIPAFWDGESLMMCFDLSDDEINRVKATGEIFIKVTTFGLPMQPITLNTLKEQLIPTGWTYYAKD